MHISWRGIYTIQSMQVLGRRQPLWNYGFILKHREMYIRADSKVNMKRFGALADSLGKIALVFNNKHFLKNLLKILNVLSCLRTLLGLREPEVWAWLIDWQSVDLLRTGYLKQEEVLKSFLHLTWFNHRLSSYYIHRVRQKYIHTSGMEKPAYRTFIKMR